MNQPLVSVVIATYNMAQYLPQAIESVLAQTWEPLELIIIDDGSTDGTASVVAPFLKDARVQYLPQKNLGQPKAKNAGINACKGKYIGFCDGDDIWEPNKLSIQIPKLEADPTIGVVYSTVTQIDATGMVVNDEGHVGYSGKITDELLIHNFIPFGTAVVRKRCLEQCGIFDENLPMGIDWDLWLRISLHWSFLFIPQPTYRYRVWPGQMSKNHRGRYKNAVAILEKFFLENPNSASNAVKRRAWSDTYCGRAASVSRAERKIAEPLQDALRAVFTDPLYGRAWKTIVKVLMKKN